MPKDIYTKQWITDNALEIIQRYEKGMLTIRALHYQLVSIGMTNDDAHYKRVGTAMTDARWSGLVDFDTFIDNERTMIGETANTITFLDEKVEEAKYQIKAWMNSYSKNMWENQKYYIEVFIEKKALQSVFIPICRKYYVALGACKGYPSLTFLYDSAQRFIDAEMKGMKPVILYFGDYDPSGEDIPRSIVDNIKKIGCSEIKLVRYALNEQQVIEWKLPPAPTKKGDSRSNKWTGLGQVELDAIEPSKLQKMCKSAILDYFDSELYDELIEQENNERVEFRKELIEYVNNINTD